MINPRQSDARQTHILSNPRRFLYWSNFSNINAKIEKSFWDQKEHCKIFHECRRHQILQYFSFFEMLAFSIFGKQVPLEVVLFMT